MRAPPVADLVAVIVAAYWLKSYAKRAALREVLQRAKKEAPAQYAVLAKLLPKLDSWVETGAGQSYVIPAAVGAYAVVRLRGGGRCRR